jgi:hypothetical protein
LWKRVAIICGLSKRITPASTPTSSDCFHSATAQRAGTRFHADIERLFTPLPSLPGTSQDPMDFTTAQQIDAALERPAGFASYSAVQQWIATELGVTMGYHAVHKLVRYKFRAKLKVPRPSHIKKRRRHRRL